eukprot:GHVS01080103.1.p1 GENE.GHVS01080103.1~~GHVS01080103.1.p1  ORF type:complete len:472 (+),score=75.71 GHVS01080103.1:126-1541(+)
MKKVSVLHHNPLDFNIARHGDIQRYYRNPDKNLHPFEKAREYARAMAATKMDKMFAKPLVGSLDGHHDSVKSLARCHRRLGEVVSGSCDGEIRFWNLSDRRCLRAIKAHDGFVRGVCLSHDDVWVFSCGDDKRIKQWRFEHCVALREMDVDALGDVGHLTTADGDTTNLNTAIEASCIFEASSILTSIDHHWQKPLIATSGQTVDIWDQQRSAPLQSFEWGCDMVYSVRFNPSEPGLLASTGADNSIGLYDIRGNSAIRKVVMKLRSNAVTWNPMQPLNFTVANEDCNLYTFDMRRLDTALTMHKDFTGPVLDVDYSPQGTEFVAASYDRTVRLFGNRASRSRDVYHTKRMQTVLATRFSGDGRFVLSGSADMCVRVWKAEASAPLGARLHRERAALVYRDALKAKFSHLPEIKRIQRHHHVPAFVKRTTEKRRIIQQAAKRKDDNRRKHSKPGSMPRVSAARKPIVKQLE